MVRQSIQFTTKNTDNHNENYIDLFLTIFEKRKETLFNSRWNIPSQKVAEITNWLRLKPVLYHQLRFHMEFGKRIGTQSTRISPKYRLLNQSYIYPRIKNYIIKKYKQVKIKYYKIQLISNKEDNNEKSVHKLK